MLYNSYFGKTQPLTKSNISGFDELQHNTVFNLMHQLYDAIKVSQPVEHQDGFTCEDNDNESRFKPYLEDLIANIIKNKQALIDLQNVKNHIFRNLMNETEKNKIIQIEVKLQEIIKKERKRIGEVMVDLYEKCLETNPTNGKIFNYLDKFKTQLEYFDQHYAQYSDELNLVESLPLFIPPKPRYIAPSPNFPNLPPPLPPRNIAPSPNFPNSPPHPPPRYNEGSPNYLPPPIPEGGKRKTKRARLSKQQKSRSYKLF